jgi:uncharacterized protein YeaO (DUF488 family)
MVTKATVVSALVAAAVTAAAFLLNPPAPWQALIKNHSTEMSTAENRRTIDVLAKRSQHSDFSAGCCCKNEAPRRRSALPALLAERGTAVAADRTSSPAPS